MRNPDAAETYLCRVRHAVLNKTRTLIAAIAGAACAAILALAQVPAVHAVEANAAKAFDFSIPAQSIGEALMALGAQSGLTIIVETKFTRGVRAAALSGTYTPEQALKMLLEPVGLKAEYLDSKTVAVRSANDTARASAADSFRLVQVDGQSGSSGEEQDSSRERAEDSSKNSPAPAQSDSQSDPSSKGIPELLVRGERFKSLNAGIRRTQDDIQPYQVIGREQIERSGARNVQELLRRATTATTGGLPQDQTINSTGNTSSITLRDSLLGSDETLILVDGRRIGVQSFIGSPVQPDINGIPLSAIERIEVLPSSASGIYGGGATGGVINIILRRDYSGLNAKATFGSTAAGAGDNTRIDVSGGLSFNNEKTTLMIAASRSENDGMRYGDLSYIERYRDHLLQVNPGALTGPALFTPPIGSTTNIRSTAAGVNLTLKPAFGGGAVGSTFTSVPLGYAGPAADSGAGLIANAGQYNLSPANTSERSVGNNGTLLAGSLVESVDLTLRQEMSPRFDALLETTYSRNIGRFANNGAFGSFTLSGSDAGNPFNEDIRVSAPFVGLDADTESHIESIRVLGGVTFDIAAGWRGAVDLSWNSNTFEHQLGANLYTALAATAVQLGELNVFADINSTPGFAPYASPNQTIGPSTAESIVGAARLSGPVPLRLPGGQATVSLLLESREDSVGQFVFTFPASGVQQTSPKLSQNADAIYGEVLLPFFTAASKIPGLSLLELQIAARLESYRVEAARTVFGAPLTSPGEYFSSEDSALSRTIGLRYAPVDGVVLRASFAEGFLGPSASQIIPELPSASDYSGYDIYGVVDPARGNTPLGVVTTLSGGNPGLKPESTESVSAGVILTPGFLRGFRLSVDWTRINKSDAIGSPFSVFNIPLVIQLAPERIVRDTDPATFGTYGVGPIVTLDSRSINIAKFHLKAFDIALDQLLNTAFGDLHLSMRATRTTAVGQQVTPAVALRDVLWSRPHWQANASIAWERNGWAASWFTRYIADYGLLAFYATSQGATSIGTQVYHDLYTSYEFSGTHGSAAFRNVQLSLGIRNVFDKLPPLDVSNTSGFYSGQGDPIGMNYAISVAKRFE